jgi:hypothetical protein
MVVTRARSTSKKHPLFPVKSSNDRQPFWRFCRDNNTVKNRTPHFPLRPLFKTVAQ